MLHFSSLCHSVGKLRNAELITFLVTHEFNWLQIQGEGRALVAVNTGSALLVRGPAAAQYNGLVGTIITIARQEGTRYVYPDALPAWHDEWCPPELSAPVQAFQHPVTHELCNVALGLTFRKSHSSWLLSCDIETVTLSLELDWHLENHITDKCWTQSDDLEFALQSSVWGTSVLVQC